MKYGIIIPDGAADGPFDELGGQTPLEAAALPTLDSLAVRGCLGTAWTVAEGQPSTEAATDLGVLGYDPLDYPAGEGALAAHARGLDLGAQDQVLCCNFVTVIDGYLRDFSAGFIGSTEAAVLIDALNAAFGSERFHFEACGGYRNLCVWENAGSELDLRTTPPDRILNEPVKPCLPSGNASKPLCDLIARADALLREHDVNLVRQDLGENPATGIWPWGHGPLPTLPAFQERHGVHGTLVAGGDVVRGIGRLIGWNVLDLTGATGLADTDYAAKGRAAMAAMDSYDLVCVHVQAPHTLGMLGDAAGKARALEAIDRQVVAPLLERLQAEPDWRLLVIAAQASGAVRHPELAGRTPFILGGTGVESHRGEAFDEQNAAHGELHLDRASDLMEYFLRR